MNVSQISDKIQEVINAARPKQQMLPAILAACSAANRPGLSALQIAAKVLSKKKKSGFLTGLMPDGSQNGYDFSDIVNIKEMVNAIKLDHKISDAPPLGSIIVGGTTSAGQSFSGSNVAITKWEIG